MRKTNQIIQSAVTGLLVLTLADQASAANAVTAQETEKCYGIVKKGMNDCQTSRHSCAGSGTEDKQLDAYILLPKGTCNKIVGGNLTPPAEQTNDKNKI